MKKNVKKYVIIAIIALFIAVAGLIAFISVSGIFGENMQSGTENTRNTSGDIITYNTSGDDSANYVDGNTEGEKSHWVKNGDVWTYTFYVDDPNAQWNIWEDSETLMEGYTGDFTENNVGTLFSEETLNEFTPESKMSSKQDNNGKTVYTWLDSENAYKVTDNGDGTFTKITTKLSFTITNTKQGTVVPEVEKGSLTIQKIVKDSDGNALTENDDSSSFQFTVTLSAGTANSELIEGTKIFGNVVFKNKQAKLSLKAGKSITIPNLPAGISYSIVENTYSGYTTEYEGQNGNIAKDTESQALITNTKKKAPEPTPGPSGEPGEPAPEQKYVDITIRKSVTGNNEIGEESTIEVELNNLIVNTEYELSNGTKFYSNAQGTANVSIILSNNQTITLKNIPVGAKYKAFEYAGDYISSYVITDSNNKGLIANTANRNAKTNVAITTATETADEDEDVTITFTNKKIVTQNLKLIKTVTDEADENDYMFDIEFGEMEEGSSFNSTAGRVIAEANGKAELSVYLANGESVEFYEVPVGTTYRIKELASSSIASYTIIDKNAQNKITKEADSNSQAKKALSTEFETVNQGEEVTVNFINNTVDQEPDSVEVSLGITKNVQNKAGEEIENCEDTFDFELEKTNESSPMPEKTNVKVTGNGSSSFGTITFTETGTYTYKITEKAGNDGEYEYDNSEYIVTVEVTNPEGLLEISQSVKKNGFASEAIVFTNKTDKYEPEPENPVEPDPEDPTEPENPEEPVNPEKPTEPEKPEEPVNPENPTEPEKPEEPVNPEKPTEPKNPEEPKNEEQKNDEDNTQNDNRKNNEKSNTKEQKEISKVPQTGQTRIVYIVLSIAILVCIGGIIIITIKMKNKNK